MFRSYKYSIAALTFFMLFMCSCSILDRQTVFYISIHELVSETERVEGGLIIVVKTPDEQIERHIRRFPLLSSANIYKAEVLPGDDGVKWGLRLFFDETAKAAMWREASGYHSGEEVAVVVDGFFSGCTALPSRFNESGILEVRPLWSKQEAQYIVNNVERNYKLSND